MVVNLVVSSSANISIKIDSSIVYVHKSDVESMIKTHNISESAHENRFKLFEKISELGNDIIQKLALTSTVTAINALQTNSWFGQLLKMVLTASGVKYNIAQNGYVCLGSFFGGLIIQWGTTEAPTNKVVQVSLPIAFNNPNWVTCGIGNNGITDFSDNIVTLCKGQSSVSTICFHTVHESAPSISFIVIGK